jgi:hypothetical protein
MKAELDEPDDDEPPDEPPLAESLDDDGVLELELDDDPEPDDPPADTVSPLAPDTDAIVPFAGARSLVDASASSALDTLSSALATLA